MRPRLRGQHRHGSLHDAIEWSYRLLDAPVQRSFERLSVCAGPFGLDLAAAVTDHDRSEASEHIERLVDASLLLVDHHRDRAQYRMLEPLRTFAAARLSEHGEHALARERYVAHVVASADRVMRDALADWRVEGINQVLDKFDHVAAALRWCLDNDTEPTRAFLLCTVLWGVTQYAHVDDIATWSESALRRWPEPDHPLAGDVAATLATAWFTLGRPDEAIELASRALDADGSVVAPVTLRRAIALSMRARGNLPDAVGLFAEAAQAAREVGQIPCALEADALRAQTLADLGETGAALDLVREARAEAGRVGSTLTEVLARCVQGDVLRRTDARTAIPVVEDALAAARRISYAFAVCANLRTLALAHLACNDTHAAARRVLELLDEQTTTSAVWDPGGPLTTAALVLHRSGHPAWRDLAATVRDVPSSNPLVGQPAALADLPEPGGDCRSWPDALALARRALADVVDGTSPTRPAPAAPADATLRRDGDMWTVTFDGVTVHVKASRGMDDLARLLTSPDADLHCLDLIGAAVVAPDTGEVLDHDARRHYEQRIRDLQAEIDDATANHDPARAEKASMELDALVDHLTAALGLDGRMRRRGSSAERARSAVTHRLRATIRRIDDLHPTLGRHLRASITTGTYCSYRPDPPVRWHTTASRHDIT